MTEKDYYDTVVADLGSRGSSHFTDRGYYHVRVCDDRAGCPYSSRVGRSCALASVSAGPGHDAGCCDSNGEIRLQRPEPDLLRDRIWALRFRRDPAEGWEVSRSATVRLPAQGIPAHRVSAETATGVWGRRL